MDARAVIQQWIDHRRNRGHTLEWDIDRGSLLGFVRGHLGRVYERAVPGYQGGPDKALGCAGSLLVAELVRRRGITDAEALDMIEGAAELSLMKGEVSATAALNLIKGDPSDVGVGVASDDDVKRAGGMVWLMIEAL